MFPDSEAEYDSFGAVCCTKSKSEMRFKACRGKYIVFRTLGCNIRGGASEYFLYLTSPCGLIEVLVWGP